MPSFFEGLKRLVQGKPVFTADDTQRPKAISPRPMQPQSSPVISGPKVIPQVYVERTESESHGNGMRCKITIQNASQAHITLQYIELLGQTRELGRIVDPGEEYELLWDFATRPRDTTYDDCNLYYKDSATTDAFCSRHTVTFEKQSDTGFTVARIAFYPPIRDV